MIIYISDFDLVGSGYMQLSIALCRELCDRGYSVTALGVGYTGTEHNWPFSIIPVPQADAMTVLAAIWQNLNSLSQAGEYPPIEAVVCALDIPYQARVQQITHGEGVLSKPHIGIFPVESGPLITSWANILNAMEERLVISRFGLDCMKAAGVQGHYIPLGLDTAAWRPPTAQERQALRTSMGFSEDQFIVLTVADNQERKNLWAGMRAMKALHDKHAVDCHWVVVTRVNSPYGWRLDEMALDLGVTERLLTFDRGLAFDRLWTLFAVADAFLLPSKAEGFCMPLIEAMACGVPVVATDCTAVPEQIWADFPANSVPRGFPIEVEYRHVDVWGNSVRSWASADDAAQKLATIYAMQRSSDPRLGEIIERGLAYARSRTWKDAADVLTAAIERVKVRYAPPPPPPVMAGLEPMTVPHIIPTRDFGEAL